MTHDQSMREASLREALRRFASDEPEPPALPGHKPRIRVTSDQERAVDRARGREFFCPECGSRAWLIDSTVQCMGAKCGAGFDVVIGVDTIGRSRIAQLTRHRAETMQGVPLSAFGPSFRREYLGTFPARPSPPFDPSDYERPPRKAKQ